MLSRRVDSEGSLRHDRHIVNITGTMDDKTVLREIGDRIAGLRLAANLTQDRLATEAGVSRSTVHRDENGLGVVQMGSFIRICRALGALEGFGSCLPQSGRPGPMEVLRGRGKRGKRKRASGKNFSKTLGHWEWGKCS